MFGFNILGLHLELSEFFLLFQAEATLEVRFCVLHQLVPTHIGEVFIISSFVCFAPGFHVLCVGQGLFCIVQVSSMAGPLGVCHLGFWCRLVCLFGNGHSVFVSQLTFFVNSIFGVRASAGGCLASFWRVFGVHHGSWVKCGWGGGFGVWVWVWKHFLSTFRHYPSFFEVVSCEMEGCNWCHWLGVGGSLGIL